MGLVLALIVIPLYFIISAVGLISGCRLLENKGGGTGLRRPYVLIVLGVVVSAAVTFVYITLVPVHGNTDWTALFHKLGAILFGPLILSVALIIINIITLDKYETPLRYFVSGVLFSAPLLPLIALSMTLTGAS